MKKQTIYKPSICQVVASINEQTGGPAQSVTNLAKALTMENFQSHIFTLDYTSLGSQVDTSNLLLHSYKATLQARLLRGYQPRAFKELNTLVKDQIDLIHNHGLWMFQNLYARRVAQKNNIPLVISPRGMLETWSMKRSQFIKSLVWLTHEYKNLESSVLFHATSESEIRSIRMLGFKQPIALIPNGVNLPSLTKPPGRKILTDRFPELIGKRWLLCLSRAHPKKGQDRLLLAWEKLCDQHPKWQLIIAGSDDHGYLEKLIIMAEKLEIRRRVTFTRMLFGLAKESALSHSELFVLPTHSENFGIAIAESLAYEVPVITTKETPWEALNTSECGWWIDNDQTELFNCLENALKLSPKQLKAMGRKGREMIRSDYSWNSIGHQMAEVYRWILEGKDPPEYILF